MFLCDTVLFSNKKDYWYNMDESQEHHSENSQSQKTQHYMIPYTRLQKTIGQGLPGTKDRILTAEKPMITFWEMEMFYILIIVRCYTTVYI